MSSTRPCPDCKATGLTIRPDGTVDDRTCGTCDGKGRISYGTMAEAVVSFLAHVDTENDPPRFRHPGPRKDCRICSPANTAVGSSHECHNALLDLLAAPAPVWQIINVCIVKQEALPMTFQARSWKEAIRLVAIYARDPFYGLSSQDRVFFRDVTEKGGGLEQHGLSDVVGYATTNFPE